MAYKVILEGSNDRVDFLFRNKKFQVTKITDKVSMFMLNHLKTKAVNLTRMVTCPLKR